MAQLIFSRLKLAWPFLLWLTGCQGDLAEPVSPGERCAPGATSQVASVGGDLPTGLPAEFLPGTISRWRWTCPEGAGTALLEIGPPGFANSGNGTFRWFFEPPLPHLAASVEITLTPVDTTAWLGMATRPGLWPVTGSPVPLARWALASPHYGHLVALLQDLTADLFQGRVQHWPKLPVPVRVGQAQSGAVDLSACLAEAVGIWNDGEPEPWFRLDAEAAWGVRLVHFPGAVMHPPLQARLTRLDGEGRPLRINIVVGDNYDDAVDRPYALRGMVHELGHALLMWGHSTDRAHVLWAAGPPLAEVPSPDERKAVRLWHGLPSGVDVNKYFSGPAARTGTWPPDARP